MLWRSSCVMSTSTSIVMCSERRSRGGGPAVAQTGNLPHSCSPTVPCLWEEEGEEGKGGRREGGRREGKGEGRGEGGRGEGGREGDPGWEGRVVDGGWGREGGGGREGEASESSVWIQQCLGGHTPTAQDSTHQEHCTASSRTVVCAEAEGWSSRGRGRK